ncbi:Cell division protein FtsZ [Rhodovastum atsumiense]|uniref:Cell division protein FtsZ n=1 Tax=Rhodovastum atsumiense TaxID=504468 RepID=A0A5M6IZ80_9PROT|nr:cell division protein FtsZ [Rhodovastum atsumiense]KAA5613591.1 cell division protein FtsZ [Rhodovastum atsumiense]CAH2599491.1 Cell division protein FtsZ [Rhodovastum atsumiense]
MTLNLTIPQNLHTDFTPRITVIGVGGGGTNAVDNMIAMNLQGVEFVVANTDAQQLLHSTANRRVQLGPHITQGLGAGAKPEIGRAAAEEAADELYRHLDGAHMVFITAGMGGGTGTGAAPVIARMAREKNILTVGVVTKPFTFEGQRRARAADEGINELQQYVDTLIVIPNQNLFRLANERTGWKEAFKMADNVLYMGVRGVTDLMVAPGLVNLDFADIRTVMAEMGKAMMGTGEAEGENRAIRAAEAAISNPLLEDTSMAGARGLLINITGGEDMTLFEVDQAANRIREEVDEEANIIFGSAVDDTLNGKIRVSVVATGIDTPSQKVAEKPKLVAVAGGAASAVASASAGANGAPLGVMAAPPVSPRPGVPGASPQARLQPSRPVIAAGPGPRLAGGAAVATAHAAPVMAAEAEPVAAAHGYEEEAEPAAPARPHVVPQPRAAAPRPAYGEAEAAQPPRKSLFGIVTGAIRGSLPAQPGAAPATSQRTDPSLHEAPREAPVRANVRQAAGEEMGIDIPAFLRRQSS